MIFETKQYHLAKQYKINGAVVRKSIFEDVQKLDKENKDLKQRNEALEDVDDIAGSYRDLAEKAIEALSGYSFRDDFQKEFDELQKEFEEIKNA